MRKQRSEPLITATDVIAVAGGTLLGMTLGYLLAGNVGRVNSARIRGAVDRWRERRTAPTRRPERWTTDDSERLEARVLDALNAQVVLARRPIRVAVLGMGLVELTGRVNHASEIGLAGDTARAVDGVNTVLNHLLAGGVDAAAGVGPSAPRAARG